MRKNQIFKDRSINEEYIKRGFVKINLFKEEELKKLHASIIQFDSPVKSGFVSSIKQYNLESKILIQDVITAFITEKIKSISENYKLVRTSYLNKYSGADSVVDLHYDDTSCDEDKYTPFHIWLPLTDTNIENGCLHVVISSHAHTNKIRGLGLPLLEKEIKDTLIENYLFPTETKLGEAVIYHPALLHYSPPNHSLNPRPAIVVVCIPDEAIPVVYLKKKKFFFERIYKIEMDSDQYVKWNEQDIPKGASYEVLNKKKIQEISGEYLLNKIIAENNKN